MNKRTNNILWIISLLLTVAIVYYQSATGPGKPVKVEKEFENQRFSFKLPCASDKADDEIIAIEVPVGSLTNTFTGIIKYKSLNSNDFWVSDTMHWEEGRRIVAIIPHQQPSEKIMYELYFLKENNLVKMTEYPVVLTFRGKVPGYIFLPYLLLIFLGILFSTRTGFEALFDGTKTYRYSFLTLVLLFIGGGILGVFVQKYAFNTYWIGWPFGHDLSNTKIFVSLVFWFVTFFKLARDKNKKWWPVIAAVMLLLVFLIPHSILGSEIDYTQLP